MEGWKKGLEKQMMRIEKQKVTEEEGEALGHKYNNILLPNLNKMDGLLSYGGQWLAAIFDADLINNALGLHLSQNETKYMYMETPEEVLIQMMKIVIKAKQTWHLDIEKAKVSRGQTEWDDVFVLWWVAHWGVEVKDEEEGCIRENDRRMQKRCWRVTGSSEGVTTMMTMRADGGGRGKSCVVRIRKIFYME
ncbi:hypothetical protein EDD15DRAFT_2204371 [Pisolithus albus]|nr:hypothetical protein EDD15DRAFT_2204371 [Pisolithus albus]